jgi:outer membrane protein OmpA-like peptidoglycan-associated protein
VLLCLALTLGCATNPRQTLLEELLSLGYDARETERGVVVFLPDVLFAFDRAELSPAGISKVDGVAQLLERLTTYDGVAAEGHTDSIGAADYNLQLSEARARSVADALIAAGIPAERLEVKGFGEERPIGPNVDEHGRDDPEARRLNRRVEMIVLVP